MSVSAIQRFIDRVRQQSRSQSKTFNMSIDEANDLSNSLALLLLRENELLQEISQLKSQSTMTEIVVNGGSFK
jgi:hypothetical protein